VAVALALLSSVLAVDNRRKLNRRLGVRGCPTEGKCQADSLPCPGGAYLSGLCPGLANIKCCPSLTPHATPTFANYQSAVMAFINKYKGATEGNPDGRFGALFGDLKKVRQQMPGFSTCTSFVPMPLASASRTTQWALPSTPNVNFFNAQLRKAAHIDKSWFYALLPAGSPFKTLSACTTCRSDTTATWVDMAVSGSPRPNAGDVFLLGFADDEGVNKVGYFAHIGFVVSVAKQTDGTEHWTVVAGGAGNIRAGQESVAESVMVVDPRTTPVATNPTSAQKRFLAGWVPLQNLFNGGHYWNGH